MWGYCLNGQAGALNGTVNAGIWGCAVESGPNDVALLWNASIAPEPEPTDLGSALTELSGVINCASVCFGGGIFGFGSNATSTSQFNPSTTFQSVTAGESSGIATDSPFSLGATFTLFNEDSTTGLLAGLSAGGCVGCVNLPVSLSFGVGPLTWQLVPLSGSVAASVDQGLNDMRTAMITGCVVGIVAATASADPNVAQATLGVCSAAFAPAAGYVSGELTSLFDTLSAVSKVRPQ